MAKENLVSENSMEIRRREEKLFRRWLQRRPDLVRDGVVDEDTYLATKPRLLFLLKEVNDPHGGGWDLREFICKGAKEQTWNNITRWVIGIRSLDRDILWNDLEDITLKMRIDVLRSSVAMNLKKSPGSHTTENKSLTTVALEDRDLLTEQFLFYQPDVTICCGSIVGDLFDEVIQVDKHGPWQKTTRGIWFREYRPGKYVVAYSHPEARVQDCLLYYGLVDAVREILGSSTTHM